MNLSTGFNLLPLTLISSKTLKRESYEEGEPLRVVGRQPGGCIRKGVCTCLNALRSHPLLLTFAIYLFLASPCKGIYGKFYGNIYKIFDSLVTN